ncbi:hypothetical protein A9R05_41955 (plasmid) [Burkholderia sp. KK1]|uniref:Uncharacterized protein n=1 Tax=Burkholderia sp. M701 TaxID=326454 RepID=V5YNL9_9BURK|nr:hypothetical protein [Burkholderia sp. M701]AQH05590.1 hypothetical protein A9R05_41955 [Burkholderia sp. KK1]BAO18854.1 hypothetical protein [Burkholderia sp. M701]
MALSDTQIRQLMLRDDTHYEQALAAFKNSIDFGGDQLLDKAQALVREMPFFDTVGLPFSCLMYGWKLIGKEAPPPEVPLAFGLGKFITFAVTAGPLLGFAGIPGLALVVLGYLEEKAEEKERKETNARLEEIAESMITKMHAIMEKVERRRAEVAAREVMTDVPDRVRWDVNGLLITADDRAQTMRIFSDLGWEAFQKAGEGGLEKEARFRKLFTDPSRNEMFDFFALHPRLVETYRQYPMKGEDGFYHDAPKSVTSQIVDALISWAWTIVDGEQSDPGAQKIPESVVPKERV